MADRKKEASKYRAIRHLRKGGLHRALGLKEDEKIAPERLEAAKKSKNGHVRQMAEYACEHCKHATKE